jgi:hypothetical protein
MSCLPTTGGAQLLGNDRMGLATWLFSRESLKHRRGRLAGVWIKNIVWRFYV